MRLRSELTNHIVKVTLIGSQCTPATIQSASDYFINFILGCSERHHKSAKERENYFAGFFLSQKKTKHGIWTGVRRLFLCEQYISHTAMPVCRTLQEHPYIYTKVNNGASLPSTHCPEGVPVWLATVLAVSALLLGWALTWLILTCRAKSKKRSMTIATTVEMKASLF